MDAYPAPAFYNWQANVNAFRDCAYSSHIVVFIWKIETVDENGVGEYGDFRRKKINQACLTKFWLLSYE
jgi:hypothetical protein